MKRMFLGLSVLLLFFGRMQHAGADTLLYTDGSLNGTFTGRTIDPPFSVTDSFTLTGTWNLSNVTVGLWSNLGAPASVQWSIGTSPFATDISSGTSGLADTFAFFNGSYSIYRSTFSIGAPTLGTGTYYLTLANATPNPLYWDENFGPSTAFQSDGIGSIPSEYFQVFGNAVTPAPVPSNLVMLSIFLGTLGIVWTGKRFKKVTCPR